MKKVLPILISVIVLITSVISVSASENVLSGVNIKNGQNSYTIELTANAPAKVTKTIISSNRILVNLDNIKVSNKLNTKYNALIDNVIVEQQGENSASIMLQGDNIAYSDVTFKQPTSIQQIETDVVDSISALSVNLSDFNQNKTIPALLLLVLGGILVAEIRFIKSKYNELNFEKSLMEKDMERTSEFKEHLMGYGNQGLKKPYTTPIYTNPKNTSLIRANYLERLQNLKTPETVTLNSLLSDKNEETKIINKIVDNKPSFGSLSNLTLERKMTDSDRMTNPLGKSEMKSHLQHLETLSKLYRQSAKTDEQSITKRLNSLY